MRRRIIISYSLLHLTSHTRKTTTMSSTLTALMLEDNINLASWNMEDEDDKEFTITLPGSPVTEDNYYDDEDANCGHHVMNKALKAFGVKSQDGLKVAGGENPTMKDFFDLFCLDIDDTAVSPVA
jgi:hypothetical protein